MAEINLSQAEADALIVMEKHSMDDTSHDFPNPGEGIRVPLVSSDKRENFLLDLSRGKINFSKIKYQNRARQVVHLVRLELNGSPHCNPDGEVVPCPHIHIYREGFSDKWAYPVPMDRFADLNDRWRTLDDFMRYCNITKPPTIQRGIFT